MTRGSTWALAAALLGGGMAWWWIADGAGSRRARAASVIGSTEAAPPSRVATSALALAEAPAQRSVLEETQAGVASATRAGAEPSAERVLGRVLDPLGFPVPSVAVGWSNAAGGVGTKRASTGSDGSFELEVERIAGAEIRCLERHLVTLVSGTQVALEPPNRVVVVAPRADFAGVVVDPAGAPVAGAKLTFGVREALLRELGLGSSDRPVREATTDERGAFELVGLAGGEGVFLQVEAEGFWIALVDLPEAGAADLVIRVERDRGGATLIGTVIERGGAAVAGARVSVGDGIVTTDDEGRFELALGDSAGRFGPAADDVLEEPPIRDAWIVALKPGLRPARERLADLDPNAPVVLQLGTRPESIRGRVLDAEGRLRSGVIVWPRDTTPFGREVESLAEGMTFAWVQSIEEELAGGADRLGALSDGRGEFELGALLPRAYELMAFDPATGEQSGPWTIDAGRRGVELVLSSEPLGPAGGRVVSAAGRALAGVRVSLRRIQDEGELSAQAPPLRTRGVTTDSDGRFRLERVALASTELVLEDERFFVRRVRLVDQEDPASLRIVEPVLCKLQVDLTGDPGLADTLRVLDREGSELEMLVPVEDGVVPGQREAYFREGMTRVLSVGETAATLVLYEGEREVLRRPLRLDPERATRIRP